MNPTDTNPSNPTEDTTHEPIVAENQSAYESLKATLAATPHSDIKSLNLKIAATRTHSLHQEITKPDAADLLTEISDNSKLFKKTNIALLVVVANAASHAYAMLKNAKALKDDSKAKLPKDLVDASTAHRALMLDVAQYNLGHLPTAATILADIRSGSGYIDLATDLDRLGKLYIEYKAILKKDQTKYNAADAQRAFDLDQQITQHLGTTKQGQIAHWVDQSARITALLRATYDDVAATGRWIFRNLPEDTLTERFPSLFAGKGGGHHPKKI